MLVQSQMCERARSRVSLRLDDEISALESALLDGHLERCAACREFAGCAEAIARAVRSLRHEGPAIPTRMTLRSRTLLRGLQVAAAGAVVVGWGVAATLMEWPAQPAPAKRVAVVATAETPDALRELRRTVLLSQEEHPVPRNRGDHGTSI